MNKPRWGEPNLGAMTGAVLGGLGGLFAIAIPLAILRGDIGALSEARAFGVVGFFLSAPVGWLLGGQIGGHLARVCPERCAHLIGGVLGGLIPVGALALWGWYLVKP